MNNFYKIPLKALQGLQTKQVCFDDVERACIEHYRLQLKPMGRNKKRESYNQILEHFQKKIKQKDLSASYEKLKDGFETGEIWGAISCNVFRLFSISNNVDAFCLITAINSLQGRKQFFMTNKKILLCRMLGFICETDLQENPELFKRYLKITRTRKTQDYFLDKLLQELYEKDLLKGRAFTYRNKKRVLVLSTKIQSVELFKIVKQKRKENLKIVSKLARQLTEIQHPSLRDLLN